LSNRTSAEDVFDDFDEITDDITDIRWEDIPALFLLGFLIVVVGLQFFTRYVLNNSIAWTEEAARYCLVVLTFWGSAICVRQGSHLLIGVIYRHIPTGLVKPLALFNEVVVIGFFGAIAWLGVLMSERTSRQMMITMPFPKSYIYSAITLGCILAVLYGLINLWRISRRNPEEISSQAIGGV
jgi:TRAP-type C4-dicarboxylate transport system permease small subunit